MIPRLQPRPSPSSRQPEIENRFSVETKDVDISIPQFESNSKGSSVSSFTKKPKFYERPMPAFKDGIPSSEENRHLSKGTKSLDDAQLSPSRSVLPCDQPAISPVPNHYGSQYKHLLNYTSSASDSFDTDSSYNDFSLTPPSAGSRPPLLVSAKRYGNEVRRQHNKRRRRRRRPTSTKLDPIMHLSVRGNLSDTRVSDSCKENGREALCLWKGDFSGKDDDNFLPFLASSDEEEELPDRIEELVRAEHLKEAMGTRGNGKLSFSANRAPPPKGCLSNQRPKRPKGQTTRYKTPPKSTDEFGNLSESNFHQSRRVQFGNPSAVEYEIDRPPGHLTPMSQEVTRNLYPMDPKEPTRDENEITQETKQNSIILSEWEDHLPKMSINSKRSSDRSRRRYKRNRRSSSIFSLASHLSSVYDYSNEANLKKTNKELVLTRSGSNSAAVTRNAASLSAFTQATPISTDRREDESQTWDFVADLGSINSKGAMELSPLLASPRTIESAGRSIERTTKKTTASKIQEENKTPTISTNHDTINNSDLSIGNISTSYLRSLRDPSGVSDESLSYANFNHNKSLNIISETLIESPWLDQEWDFVTILKNLSFVGGNEHADIIKSIVQIDPCVQNVLSCASDFREQVKRTLSLKKPFAENLSNQHSITSAESAILTEWKEIEISLIEDLTKLLDRYRLELEKTNDLQNKSNYLFLSHHCPSNLQPANEQNEETFLIENEIHLQKSSLDMLDASVAPFSCILCQATAQIGIYGFCLEEFRDDHILQLNYMHSVFGAKTRVTIDVNSESRPLVEHNCGASENGRDSVFDFHRDYINMLSSDKSIVQLQCTELHDSLLKIGKILGKLDQIALAMKTVHDRRKTRIVVDFPNVSVVFPAEDKIVSLALDPESFMTRMVSVSTADGSIFEETRAEDLSLVDCFNLNSLGRIVSQYT